LKSKIQILSNTNYALEDVLKSELISCSKTKIAVAFLKKSGVDKINEALEYALVKNGAEIEFIVGLDFKTTDYIALSTLNTIGKKHSNFKYYCFGDKKDNYNELIFHPKIYLFSNESQYEPKYTSIVGSSNLTGGGLANNFEVNTVFREIKPIYFSQLMAIYNEIKYTDSIFVPDKDYLEKYSYLKNKIDNSDLKTSKLLNSQFNELRKAETLLPGTVPTLKKIIIDIIKEKMISGMKEINLQIIYKEASKLVTKNNYSFKMDTFDNSVRGELNKHEKNSKHPQSMSLFIRTSKSNYALTEKGFNYNGR